MKRSKILSLLVLLLLFSQSGCSLLKSQNPKHEEPQPTPDVTTPQVKTDKDSEDLYSTYQLKEEKHQAQKPQIQDKVQAQIQPAPTSMAAGAVVNEIALMHTRDASSKKVMGIPPRESRYYPYVPVNTESYDSIPENKVCKAKEEPLSTFSIDVDTASYSNIRRFLEQNQKPPVDAVRIEEMINYFSYDYPAPDKEAFSVNLETAQAPWDSGKKLVRIGIKGKEIKADKRPASNLVFLIDVSGSMDSSQKLPLVKAGLSMLVEKLNQNDNISIVVYAGAAGLVLKPTHGDHKVEILKALDRLKAGGSTNGAGGIELAYKTAAENFIKGGVNRVILATDGDFNVGVTNREDLLKIIKKHADNNIYLSVLGFGMGNYKDGMMEALSNKGNGNYAYVDSMSEARKVLVEQMTGTLITIAKDVKIQVEFNPKLVESYRLIGYEDRIMAHEDFNNDKKDAGDIGAGHTVTALYEITPVGATLQNNPPIDPLKYQQAETKTENTGDQTSANGELLTVKLRYKKPDGLISKKIEIPLQNSNMTFSEASKSFKFASSVAMFGMYLRESQHSKNMTLEQIKEIANASKGSDPNGYKAEFVGLIEKFNKIQSGFPEPQLGYFEE